MLLRNGRTLFQNPGRANGVTSGQSGNIVRGGFRNRFVGGLSATFGGYANGHLAPSSFVLPTASGSISSYTRASASISASVSILTPALPMAASGAMTLTVTAATLDQILQLIASGTLVISANADLSSAVSMAANGDGVLSVTSAQLGGIYDVLASGSCVLSSSVSISALAFMIAEAGGPTELSPEGLAAAVWNEALATYTTEGSAGSIVKKIKTNADLIPAAL